ncbi:MAG TPA: hypothetical protein VK154_12055 [Chitinophagales bacterium]|nr:hypothetical protein [Chitinophagales bacterium]
MKLNLDWFDRDTSAAEKYLFVTDLVMMVLILLNLGFFVFDWSFTHDFFRDFVYRLSPQFHDYYGGHIHPDFILYDLWFVVIYVVEIAIRWVIALVRKTYTRWYLYPLIHWYDVLGCIPMGTFRWLRLLRVFAVITRMHKLGVIDLKQTLFFEQGIKLWEIFMEELTDRVFVQVLESAKQEIIKEDKSSNSAIADIIKPHQEALARWITTRVRHVTQVNYTKYRGDLKQLIDTTITDAFTASEQMKKMEKIPLVGSQITHALQATLQDIVFQLLDSSAKSVYEKNGELYQEALTSTIDTLVKEEKDEEINGIIKNIVVSAIEKVQADIGEKRWMK